MKWSTQAVREAAAVGDYGRVIKLTRVAKRLSQKQLGEACGTSQSAISRLESHGTFSYDMTVLARIASSLEIPLNLVGLADHVAVPPVHLDGTDVERRNFLAAGAAVTAAPALAALIPVSHVKGGEQAATLRVATAAFRRMDATTTSRHLLEPVLAHLRLTQNVAQESDQGQRLRLAATGSEAASLAAWLSWDIGDHGSARTWYGTAIKAARRSGDQLLIAYQIGSLAQFEADAGNAAQSLALIRAARRQLGAERPAIAEAWLSVVEALAHSANGDRASTDGALTHAMQGTEKIAVEDAPPWPWVFTLNSSKVASYRLACGARLGLAQWVFAAQDAASLAFSNGHEKQHALLMLDVAFGHMAAGRLDGAFALGTRALETGLRYRSGRVVERARALRRSYTSPTPAKIVRDFDERLHNVYM